MASASGRATLAARHEEGVACRRRVAEGGGAQHGAQDVVWPSGALGGIPGRYRHELGANPDGWRPILVAIKRSPVTLLYSAHDTEHNGALVLRDYLTEREKKRPARSAAARRRSRR